MDSVPVGEEMIEYNRYDFITKLPLSHKIDDSWWKLKWKPIKWGTYNINLSKYKDPVRFRAYRCDWNNGWGRSWKQLNGDIWTPFGTIVWWFSWDHKIHEDGPMDWKRKMRINKEKMRFEWV